MFLLKCAAYNSKRSKLFKQQETSRLLNNFGIKTTLSKIRLVGPLLFQRSSQVNTRYKAFEKVNLFLLVRRKFSPEMHLNQPGITYSDFGPFTKDKK